ncbi:MULTISPECIES: bifunctional alpha,alpha-trehalose-phosphate synthase (UDP-forming)/trehalose-phosphatase [unclassified Flavobacterium]|uniref:bifunctional alpha,alpha-trehalose-phosphate synthase (UDP-forming)/trehalose-phosphatase n=1 Tax=unclassified Flavobacterium TaxID=196869 RepID=UPI000869E7A8|nr:MULTISPECIES: bifunctional alpha,alpha-trehalose-phosphate synthase (UDP-forming)/trehalose-phosphatase [unclassified Flavobacterium]MBN9286078.1 bifunctional alpha,alpha-trehalose-phosphate synthase (UDP-forming)/trehalose-phosphatase [Flavobacterium sp.]ODS78136.1 MAG: bifunctional alpha,alpha-trehalose-phosphate synthase (UDP-forming)/trehalose-phosphatase [Chryseobacterium sp. SCN 40-13]OJV68391.1 MAG: bifunctional alpha,alpha-trehalose-phosphate synthase (UDP-forming)/trehalose-phosphata
MKLVIISNRLPLKVVEEEKGYRIVPSTGGLTTGLSSLETTMETHWIGWPGLYIEEPGERKKIDRELELLNYHPVYLTPDQIENYYEGYSNSVIWPLFHYFFSNVRYQNDYWDAYKEVNALFCEKALEVIATGDTIWVQDYQLMLLPRMIREKMTDISIGYFHHIPFPSYELFRSLPERAEILSGLLGADLIAFHTHGYMRHFISTIYRVMKLDCHLDEIYLHDRIVDVDAFPMGINYEMFHTALLNPDISRRAEELKKDFGSGKLVLSVDRLDYSKGILMRLKSFEYFLNNNPQYQGKVSLVMIVAPSRDNVAIYAKLKEDIDRKVGAVNGQYSTADWRPVYYFYRSFRFEELAALYNISSICLVNPFRDGMNLVAKEYVASKRDGKGVLILSEMAGASIELPDALIVNPNDLKEIESAILQALEMSEEEQSTAISNMQEIISVQHVGQWAKDFIEELAHVKKKNKSLQQKVIQEVHFNEIRQAYTQSRNRLIILDYDGTLAAFHSNPMKAYPTPEILHLLEKMSSDAANRIIISSGRDRQTLESWLGHLPLGIAAEHGMFYKEQGEWQGKTTKMEWDSEIITIMKHTVKKTPRSKLEIKEAALVFHYRDVDVWLAELRVTQLINDLINPCSRQNLQIMKGNKIIEVKPGGYNKGTEALRLAAESNYDFVMAIGDDTTDEEMFIALPAGAVTIKVGKTSNAARYNIPKQADTIGFLYKLTDKQG